MIKLIYPQLDTLVKTTDSSSNLLFHVFTQAKLAYYSNHVLNMPFGTIACWKYVFTINEIHEHVL